MLAMLLPIPAPKQKVSLFFVPYDVKEGYINFSCQVQMRGNDSMMELRQAIQNKYGQNPASYTITKVSNNDFQRYFNHKHTVDDF